MNNLLRLLPLIGIGIFSIIIGYKKNHEIPFPFRCTSFATYHLNDVNGKKFTLSVAQDLRFQTSSEGYLLLSGQAKSDEGLWNIQRDIVLSQGAKKDSDTFKFHIKRISVAPEDNLPGEYFTPFIREFTIDDLRMQLDVIKVGEKVYIVGSPFSFLFSCVRY